MKKAIITISLCFALLIGMVATIVLIGFCAPAQYGATYYAELPDMFDRLKNTEGKKIIVVGGSSVAFGLRGDLIEQEIDGYTVCPFGLYGSIGTKAMMDLSKVNIGEGDIVLIAPEQGNQSQSLYFGAEHLWKAVDGRFDLLNYVALDDAQSMTGTFISFVSQKFEYWSGNCSPVPTGVYAKSSFDKRCTMIFDRPHNIMPAGADENNRISYDKAVADSDFLNYVNEYNAYVKEKGATLLFAFSPVNAYGIAEGTEESDVDAFYDYLDENLDCALLGNPGDYVFEKEWFYDSNVHCNSAGAVMYTRQLVKDLKGIVEDTSPVGIAMPEMPTMPSEEITDGDNSHASFFEYEEYNGGVRIIGMTEEGLKQKSVVIPTSYNGKKVWYFTDETFVGNTSIEELKLQSNISSIADGSFSGCTALQKLYVAPGQAPSKCSVYAGLLNGAPSCKIYVESALLSDYAQDYFWSAHAGVMVAY